jgi:hypothetical protein
VRARLAQLLATGQTPEGSFPDISLVMTSGLEVAAALERLADVPPPERTPTHLDERR